MAAIFEHAETVKLDPKPGFVVKTKIVDGPPDHLYSTKVFINVCHEPRVPKPSVDFDPKVVFPLIVKNEWEIPIIVSLEKRDTDKKGVPLFVYDCCINSTCYQWVQVSKDLRMILVEWALESVEMMHNLVLEREYSLPKLACKGELSKTEITQEDLKNGLQKRLLELKQNETAGLIEELLGGQLGTKEGSRDEEELPDLSDILGTRHKPLIEEIGEMSLEETKNKGEHKNIDNLKHKSHPALVLLEPPKLPESEGSLPIRYKFTITQKSQNDHFYVLFESQQLTKNIDISFHRMQAGSGISHKTVTLKNLDPSRILEKDNLLEIVVPLNFQPYKAFVLERKGQVYIFCREQRENLENARMV